MMTVDPPTTAATVDTVVRVCDLVGVLANALLGGVLARSRGFDVVGFVALAIMSGLGGGMIRDALLQQGPAVALVDDAYLVTALVGALVAYGVPLGGDRFHRLFPYVDAIALGTWAAVGAEKGLSAGVGWLPSVLLGVVTAVGGGMARDVVLGSTPSVLGGNTLYVTPAVLAGSVLVGMRAVGAGPWAVLAAVASGVLLTALAVWRGWTLPEAPTRLVRLKPHQLWRPRRHLGSG